MGDFEARRNRDLLRETCEVHTLDPTANEALESSRYFDGPREVYEGKKN